MLKRLRITSAILFMLTPFVGILATSPAYAANPFQADACGTLNQVDSSAGSDCGGGSNTTVTSTLATVINILSFIVAAVAVIMIIVSGMRFITSQGDASGVANARTGLIYAMVGLAVVALAQAIVHFVLGKI